MKIGYIRNGINCNSVCVMILEWDKGDVVSVNCTKTLLVRHCDIELI